MSYAQINDQLFPRRRGLGSPMSPPQVAPGSTPQQTSPIGPPGPVPPTPAPSPVPGPTPAPAPTPPPSTTTTTTTTTSDSSGFTTGVIATIAAVAVVSWAATKVADAVWTKATSATRPSK